MPVTVRPSSVERRPSQPIRARISRSASPAWVVRARPVAHGHRAAGDQRPARGTARRWTGPARSRASTARTGPGATAPAVRRRCRRPRRRARAASRRSCRCGGATAPACRRGGRRRPRRSGRRRAAARRRTATDAEASIDDRAAAAPRRVPRTVNGSVPRPSSSTRDAEAAQRRRAPRRSGAVRACGSPSKATGPSASAGDRRHEPHHGAGQPAVDRRRRRSKRPGVTAQSSPAVSTPVPSAVSAAAISSVSRERSARRTTRRAVGERGQHSARLVSDLRPGQRDARRRPGRAACGAGQRSAWSVIARSVSTRAERSAEPSDLAASLASQLGLAGAGAWPRGVRRSTARRARQATPGLPSVSTRRCSRPPSIETFLKKWTAAGCAWLPCPSPPRTGGRHGGRHQRGGQHGGGEPRRPAGGQRAAGDDLGGGVDPHQRHRVVGDRQLRDGLLSQRHDFRSTTGLALAARPSGVLAGR